MRKASNINDTYKHTHTHVLNRMGDGISLRRSMDECIEDLKRAGNEHNEHNDDNDDEKVSKAQHSKAINHYENDEFIVKKRTEERNQELDNEIL